MVYLISYGDGQFDILAKGEDIDDLPRVDETAMRFSVLQTNSHQQEDQGGLPYTDADEEERSFNFVVSTEALGIEEDDPDDDLVISRLPGRPSEVLALAVGWWD